MSAKSATRDHGIDETASEYAEHRKKAGMHARIIACWDCVRDRMASRLVDGVLVKWTGAVPHGGVMDEKPLFVRLSETAITPGIIIAVQLCGGTMASGFLILVDRPSRTSSFALIAGRPLHLVDNKELARSLPWIEPKSELLASGDNR